MPTDGYGPHRLHAPIAIKDRAAFRRWRAWARHTYILWIDGAPEDPEEAWRRRWHQLPEKTKAEFMETPGGPGTAERRLRSS